MLFDFALLRPPSRYVRDGWASKFPIVVGHCCLSVCPIAWATLPTRYPPHRESIVWVNLPISSTAVSVGNDTMANQLVVITISPSHLCGLKWWEGGI